VHNHVIGIWQLRRASQCLGQQFWLAPGSAFDLGPLDVKPPLGFGAAQGKSVTTKFWTDTRFLLPYVPVARNPWPEWDGEEQACLLLLHAIESQMCERPKSPSLDATPSPGFRSGAQRRVEGGMKENSSHIIANPPARPSSIASYSPRHIALERRGGEIPIRPYPKSVEMQDFRACDHATNRHQTFWRGGHCSL
jgi:hypothetical protein